MKKGFEMIILLYNISGNKAKDDYISKLNYVYHYMTYIHMFQS